MRIATWNINGVKARLEGAIAWLKEAIQQGLDSPVREWEGVDELVRLARERDAAP